MEKFVFVVMLEEAYMHHYEMFNSELICVCESEGDGYKYADAYMNNIVDKLKGLDPETYGYYRLDNKRRDLQTISYWSNKYETNIDAYVRVVCTPYVKKHA